MVARGENDRKFAWRWILLEGIVPGFGSSLATGPQKRDDKNQKSGIASIFNCFHVSKFIWCKNESQYQFNIMKMSSTR